jgi:hypothetical protein
MMRPSNDLTEIYLCMKPVDFRKGINGLAVMVECELERDLFTGQLFVFTNRRRDKVKILYWEKSGFCLWLKRLESERLTCMDALMPRAQDAQERLSGRPSSAGIQPPLPDNSSTGCSTVSTCATCSRTRPCTTSQLYRAIEKSDHRPMATSVEYRSWSLLQTICQMMSRR